MRKFLLDKGPYLRSVDEKSNSTAKMMHNLLIAMIPLVLFAWVLYGILPYVNGTTNNLYYLFRPLVNVLIGALSSMVFEGLYFFLFKGVRGFKNVLEEVIYSFAEIPGIIIALLYPATIPFWAIILSCFIGNIIFKMLFGGLGYNIFNPAAVGYAVIKTCFPTMVPAALLEQASLIEPIIKALSNISFVSSATPLVTMEGFATGATKYIMTYSECCDSYGGLLNLFLGFKNGTMGEISIVLCILACAYLIWKKVINWRVPVLYVATVFGITWLIAIVNGIEGVLGGIWFPTFNVCTGGMFFCAVFMATEPVTTPKSVHGKSIFAIAVGICTVLFRLHGIFPEGTLTALLFVSLFTPFIDKFASANRSSFNDKKNFFRYLILSIGFACIIAYIVYRATGSMAITDMACMEVF